MQYRLPQHLHKPPRVLLMDADEAGMISIFFILAMIFGYIFWVILFVVPYIYAKQKKKYPRGFLKHMLYKVGILNFDGAPSFFENKFRE